jgi:2-deoxy-D-gluconate 3-dehydrogenase
MLGRGRGKIVFLASMMSYQGGRNVVGYAASKSGVAGVVHALANEWAARGVNVNAIAPGYIETDLTVGSHSDPLRRREFTDRIPAGRWGTPADLGGAVVFLSSGASDYLHGVLLPVDGGWLVR